MLLSERQVVLVVLRHIGRGDGCAVRRGSHVVRAASRAILLAGIDECDVLRRNGKLNLALPVFCPSTGMMTVCLQQAPGVLW